MGIGREAVGADDIDLPRVDLEGQGGGRVGAQIVGELSVVAAGKALRCVGVGKLVRTRRIRDGREHLQLGHRIIGVVPFDAIDAQVAAGRRGQHGAVTCEQSAAVAHYGERIQRIPRRSIARNVHLERMAIRL